MVSELRVTWATSVPILVFVGLSIIVLGTMYATDRQTDVRQKHRLMLPPIRGGGITSCRREAATICPRPGLQVVTRYTSYPPGWAYFNVPTGTDVLGD